VSSKGKKPPEEEVQAARQFHDLTGLVCEQLDGATGGSGQPDFSVLRTSSGCLGITPRRKEVGTLEVTRATHQPSRGLQGAMNKQASLGQHNLAHTSRMWHVQVDPDASAKTVAADIQRIVDDMEQLGADRANRWEAVGKSLNFAASHITSVRRGDVHTPPRASLQVVGLGGSTSRDVLADVAEIEVANNSKKLQPARGLERHLWVWLEFDAPDAPDAMAYSIAKGLPGGMPRDPVLNPDCTVWLAIPEQRWTLRWRGQSWSVEGKQPP
jgi:hypothetical protein